MSAKRPCPASSLPIVQWRRAAMAAMRGKARPIALIGVLPVAMDKELKTSVSNDWLKTETALDLRSVQYGLDDLNAAALIKVEVRGPKRTITAVIPPEDPSGKHAQLVHASECSEGEQIVHAKPASKGEQSKRKARTSCSPIEGRSPPNPPRSRLSEYHRSKKIAAAEPWRPGTVADWASDGKPLAADPDAGGAASAVAQKRAGSRQRPAR